MNYNIMKHLKTSIFILSFVLSSIFANSRTLVPEGIRIGNKAPEIVEKSVSGHPLKLSSLAGKVVLIDFWASWCRPCRNENPFVVAAYEKHKNDKFKGGKGFTVFSVSLDKDLNAWKVAINTDHLSWENHVCIPGVTPEYINIYQVRSIPSNFLIDGNGVILATNLRGEALEQMLASLKK